VQIENNPQFGPILADGADFTLYTFTNGGTPVPCTGGCAAVWPPLTVPAGTQPTGGQGLAAWARTLTPSGNQVTEGGLPLFL